MVGDHSPVSLEDCALRASGVVGQDDCGSGTKKNYDERYPPSHAAKKRSMCSSCKSPHMGKSRLIRMICHHYFGLILPQRNSCLPNLYCHPINNNVQSYTGPGHIDAPPPGLINHHTQPEDPPTLFAVCVAGWLDVSCAAIRHKSVGSLVAWYVAGSTTGELLLLFIQMQSRLWLREREK